MRVCFIVRAVHLELVSDLSMDAFIACLRGFISRRGKPTLLWSDHGTNFVGATSEIKELLKFLESQKAQGEISFFVPSKIYNGDSSQNMHHILVGYGRLL